MWFLRKATGTVLHNLELLFRGKKKIGSACVFFSKRIRPNGVIPYLATGKRNCLYWKILHLESRLTTGSFFHLFRWRWPAEPGCCVHYARICSRVFVTQRALRIIQVFQKSELQLDLATFSRSNSFPLVWLLTEEISFISFIVKKARVRHYPLLCTSVPQCILAALVWHFSIHWFKKEERNVLFNHPIKMTTPGTFLKLFKTPTALALSRVKTSSARISYQWTSARILNVTL